MEQVSWEQELRRVANLYYKKGRYGDCTISSNDETRLEGLINSLGDSAVQCFKAMTSSEAMVSIALDPVIQADFSEKVTSLRKELFGALGVSEYPAGF